MKISDIKPGTKILVPCVDCGVKRSLTFKSVVVYKKQKEGICSLCALENRGADFQQTDKSSNYRRGAAKDLWRAEHPGEAFIMKSAT